MTWVILKKRVTGVRGNGAGLGCGLGSVGLEWVLVTIWTRFNINGFGLFKY